MSCEIKKTGDWSQAQYATAVKRSAQAENAAPWRVFFIIHHEIALPQSHEPVIDAALSSQERRGCHLL
jgi:hypothetical protein